ncbi:unnamed protein product [Lupinus luteus]|uniref:peptidylprolyl isomerase n=1 Tax=Lupinus luteus TaxID=3873 RepID=A0AAV1WA99_LUPLU
MYFRVALGVGAQIVCSYVTLPLYALVTQMGSTMKKSIFDEQTSRALKKWHKNALKKANSKGRATEIRTLGGSPRHSPRAKGRKIEKGIWTSGGSFRFSFSKVDAEAIRERRNNKNIPIDSYITTPDGLKYYDLKEGKGPVAQKGSTVQVHFECLFRGVTAISSRESKLLAGNRSIAQPYEFTVGGEPGKERKRDFVDNPNGLFSAQASPKPPPAMYSIVEGMRVGGKRTVIVPPEKGYGQRGMNEIPPGATFELNVELLEVVAT